MYLTNNEWESGALTPSPVVTRHWRSNDMGTVSIPLTRGKYALIDEDDFPLVSQFRWRTFHDEIPESGYAYTGGHNGVPAISMHRLIIDAPRGMKVDHINGDGLDN
jgi:hypothetical protein